MSKVIQGRVATILDPHQIAFNVGSEDGVTEGSIVRLRRSVKVKDPDSDDELGTVNLIKLSLVVNLVEERYCVARVRDRSERQAGNSILFGNQPLMRVDETNIDREANAVPGRDAVKVRVGEYVTIEVAEGD